MDKPLKDWTLGEVKAYCTGRDCYKDCELAQSPGKCKILDVTPSEWDLDEKPRFTEQEVEEFLDCKIYRNNIGLLVLANGKIKTELPKKLLPSLKEGQSIKLSDIIGGAE